MGENTMKRLVVIGLLVLGLMAVVVFTALAWETKTIYWDEEHGGGPIDPQCQEGQKAVWHFVLTPGGNAELLGGTMTARFSNEDSDSASAEGMPSSVLHFYVETTAPASVEAAQVTFRYEGELGNSRFVISDAVCEELPATETPEPTSTPTIEPTLTTTPTIEPTQTTTPTIEPTETPVEPTETPVEPTPTETVPPTPVEPTPWPNSLRSWVMCRLENGELVPLQGAHITNTLQSGGYLGGADYGTNEEGLMGPWVIYPPLTVTSVTASSDYEGITGVVGSFWRKWASGPPKDLESLTSFEEGELSILEDKMVAYTAYVFSCEEAPEPTPTFPFVFPETGGTSNLFLAVLLAGAGIIVLLAAFWLLRRLQRA